MTVHSILNDKGYKTKEKVQFTTRQVIVYGSFFCLKEDDIEMPKS